MVKELACSLLLIVFVYLFEDIDANYPGNISPSNFIGRMMTNHRCVGAMQSQHRYDSGNIYRYIYQVLIIPQMPFAKLQTFCKRLDLEYIYKFAKQTKSAIGSSP